MSTLKTYHSNQPVFFHMKHFTLLFALFISNLLTAQSAWLQEGQIWQYTITLGFAGSVEGVAFVESDTIVLGKAVKKVKTQTSHPLGWWLMPDRFAYAEGGKVWMYSNKLSDFTRLYDFDLPIGDTLTFPTSYNNSNLRYRIDSTGSSQFSGQVRRFQRVRFISTNGVSSQQLLIIEGIGLVGNTAQLNFPSCSYFFIDNLQCNGIVNGADMLFKCFYENGYIYGPFSGCNSVGVQEPDQQPDIRIFPNPATETFQIQLPVEQESARIRLLNVQAQVLFASTNAALPVSIKNYSKGLYFVEITLKNGTRFIRKLVKE